MFLGFMFVAFPLIPLISGYKFEHIFLSLIFMTLGVGTYYMIGMGTDSLSPLQVFRSAGFWIFAPILFVIVGIQGMLLNPSKASHKKIFSVGFSTLWFGLLIFFDCVAIKQGNIQSALFSLIFWAFGIFLLLVAK